MISSPRSRWAVALALLLTLARPAVARPRITAPHSAPDSLVSSWLAAARTQLVARHWAASDSFAALAHERARTLRTPDSVAMAHSAYVRASTRIAQVRFADTLTTAFLLESVRLWRGMAHPDTLALAAAMDSYGVVMIERDRSDTTLAVTARARDLLPRGIADADSVRSNLWMTSASAHRRLEQPDAALAALDSARVLRERLNGMESTRVAEVLGEIGLVHAREHHDDEAAASLERAIAMIERTSGANSSLLVRPLNALAGVQNEMGDVARSIETLERAADVVVRTSGPDSPRAIPMLFNIAIRFASIGDYAGAYTVLAGLVPRSEAAFGAGNSRTEDTRLRAGAAALSAGDTAAAAPLLARAREQLRAKPIDSNHTINQVERHWSGLLMARGDLAGARRAVAEGLARERATPQPLPTILDDLLDRQVAIEMAMHDRAALDSTLAEYAQLAERAGPRTQYAGDYLRVRGRAEAWLGRRGPASEFARRSEDFDREHVRHEVRALSEQNALQIARFLGESLDLLVLMADEADPASVDLAWDRIVKRRGLVTAELAARRAPREAAADPELSAAYDRWQTAQRRVSRLEVAEAAEGPLAASHAAAETAERDYASLSNAKGLHRDTLAVDLARVRAALGTDRALVSIVTVAPASDTARCVAFVTLGPRGPLRRLDLGRTSELTPLLASWRRTLEAMPRRSDERTAERECRRLGVQVRARTWDRLTAAARGARSVVIVADGVLADLPWQALPGDHDRYLVEDGPEIETLEAERELLLPARTSTGGLLAVGDPDFDLATDAIVAARVEPGDRLRAITGDCSGAGVPHLPDLPGARAEVEDITRDWNAAHTGSPATMLLGRDGTESAFKSAAPGRDVIHLATHGILWGDSCAPVGPALRGVAGLVALDEAKPAKRPRRARPGAAASATVAPAPIRPSPWSGRRVWLALAGANHAHAGAADENEGLLTAEEVVTLDLSGVRWVVLSACQSGLGTPWPLEGSVGMRRAFRLAGARAVIASEWPLADEATREWMRAFYRSRLAGGDAETPTASHTLAAASRTVLAARRRDHRTTHPFYWAAFTASGR